MEFAFLEIPLIQGIFAHTRPDSKLAFHHGLGRMKLPIPPRKYLLENLLEETMNYFIKIQSENINMTLNIRFFIFCIIFKSDGFTGL